MEQIYWIGRKRAAMAMARASATSQARLIHYELAGRYSIRAAMSLPFLLPRKEPANGGEGLALRLPIPGREPGAPCDFRDRPSPRREPGGRGGNDR
jgi:hypothetical protein